MSANSHTEGENEKET